MKSTRCYKPFVKNPNTGKCTKNSKVREIVQCRKDKVKQVIHEFKIGKLKTPYKKVENIQQAIAIALSLAKMKCK